jgi:uncharacterized membrane protein (GlpM family)
VDGLVLKLLLTPALITGASLAARRWGPGVGGWLVGLPLTSAPVALFLALEHGAGFAAAASAGIIAGVSSQAAFALAYAWMARVALWPAAALAGAAAFACGTLGLRQLAPAALPAAALAAAALLATLRLLPAAGPRRDGARRPAWDLPLRIAVTTGYVLAVTALAQELGPQLTGLLTGFPIYAAVLAAFGHAQEGPGAAAGSLRGLLLGLFAFIAFFLVLAALLERAPLPAAFAGALAACALVQAGMLPVLRRGQPG